MKSIKLTDDRFALPDKYSAEERFAQLFGVIEETPQDIELRVSSDVAHFFLEANGTPANTLRRSAHFMAVS